MVRSFFFLQKKYHCSVVANTIIDQYMKIKKSHYNDKNLAMIFKENNFIISNYLESTESRNLDLTLKYQKKFIRSQQNIQKILKKQDQQLKAFWKNNYQSVISIINNVNSDLSGADGTIIGL